MVLVYEKQSDLKVIVSFSRPLFFSFAERKQYFLPGIVRRINQIKSIFTICTESNAELVHNTALKKKKLRQISYLGTMISPSSIGIHSLRHKGFGSSTSKINPEERI